MIGRTLSHYKVLEELSRGGMGIVYRALDVKLDREVALKVLPPELVADPERKRRFVQEAKAAAKLNHPHIGMVFEIDDADGTTFIAMELIEGEKLKDIISEQRLPLTRTLGLATEVAEGLARAHDKGIVHRDLKPANVMVTEDRHAKIIDFGLAKLVEPLAGAGSDIETLTRGETDPGKVMGTVSYMSPEQARGRTIDHQSDIFSFGIVLHELVTGQTPFKGESGVETLNAILKNPTPRLSGLGPDVPDEAAFEIQHLLDKCLAKDPSERYQTIKDTAVDIRAARRHLESGSVAPVVNPARRKPWLFAAAGALVLAAASVFLFLQLSPEERRSKGDEGAGSPSRPSIAVLYFENASGDPELDWLRSGLTDMLVTDLSQSPSLRVLSTDRLYQILRDMNRLDERVTSLEVVQEVAGRADAETVILGSFMKAGNNIRINIRVQDAPSGEILTTEKVEGTGESSIFSMVDELTQSVRSRLIPASSETNRNVWELTTSSAEAYRYFVEGRKLARETKWSEAVTLLERAVEIDPTFAGAWYSLAVQNWNLGNDRRAEESARRAIELGRLEPHQQLLLETRYYSAREDTFDRAIAAFEKLLSMGELWPASNNLPVRYWLLERYEDGIPILENYKAACSGRMGVIGHTTVAELHTALGHFDQANLVVREALAQHPDSSTLNASQGHIHLFSGNLDGAMQAYEKAISMDPSQPRALKGMTWVATLRMQWQEAAAYSETLAGSSGLRWSWFGWINHSLISLYQGKSGDAIEFLANATKAVEGQSGRISGLSRCLSAHVLLETESFGEALEEAAQAQNDAEGNLGEWMGLFLQSLAEANLGHIKRARDTAAKLLERTKSIPTQREARRHIHILGELARISGEHTDALEKLREAEAMLPENGFGGLPGNERTGPQPYVPIWYSLALAYLEAGDQNHAAGWFEHIAEATVERVEWPIYYVRSFYFLGKIYENRGEMDKTHEYYRRFYEYWGDGDMDRERMEESKSKLGTM
jgi:serine/threonine protein kinase/tetratricopeptide (TPR) repeat protein